MSFGSSKPSFTQPMAEINTTPLVDVMLVLLVIFIITAPLLQLRAVPVDLPNTDSKAIENPVEAIVVSIRESGEVFVGEQAVSIGQLPSLLAERVGAVAPLKREGLELHLHADKGTRYENVTAVMAIAQAQGIVRIAFVTQGPANAPAPDETR